VVEVHLLLAALAAVLAVLLAVVAIAAVASGHSARRALDRIILAELLVLGFAIASGGILLLTGHVLPDLLHLVYAAAAFGTLPIARFGLASLPPDRRRLTLLAATLILLVLFVRLLQTGS
jgi:hypothetical protein